MGRSWATWFSEAGMFLVSSLRKRTRKSGRLEAISTPLRSRMRPRGGGTMRKLNWLEAERVAYFGPSTSCRSASRPTSARAPTPANPPRRKVRRWKTPCRSFTSSKMMEGSKLTASAETDVGVFVAVDQPEHRGQERRGPSKLPGRREQTGLCMRRHCGEPIGEAEPETTGRKVPGAHDHA